MIAAVRRLLWKRGGAEIALAARLAELPLRKLVGLLTRHVERDPTLYAFGAARDRFGDNTAYLYLHLSARAGSQRCVWITGSTALKDRLEAAGLRAEKRWSIRGMRTSLRAGWYVVSSYTSDVNRWLADGATVLNLWHGVPLKKIERDIDSGPLRRIYQERQPMKLAFGDQTRTPDFLLSPSEFIAGRCFASAFAIPTDRCLPFGYPRTDHFLAPIDEPPHDALIADRARWAGLHERERVVGYFPTWRDGDTSRNLPGGIDLAELALRLGTVGAHLVFKPHIVSESPDPIPGVTMLAREDDADAYLPLCDVLVTDYSSLAFDFMLLRRPVVYFVPDLAEYAGYRGFYFPPEEMMPGPIVRDAEQLFAALERALDSGPDPRAAEVVELVWGDSDGTSCERLERFLGERSSAEPS